MRRSNAHLSLVLLLATAVSGTVLAATFAEDFSRMPAGTCYADGSMQGAWQFVFNGYGCSGFVSSNGNTMLLEQPMVSTSQDETHAALVLGPAISGDFTLQLSAATSRQLRANGAPNAWETAWVLWHYTDTSHFYYFIAKPNGWELGKGDPAYPGGQRFLATGATPSFPIGSWYRVAIAQAGDTIKVLVDDTAIVTFSDRERLYSSGRLGLYTEDAETYFDNVAITTSSGKGKNRR
jgi:Domain of Unknown Function (DUF1080)